MTISPSDLDALLAHIAAEVRPLLGQGVVADYIPALARISGERFGMAVVAADGRVASIGDAETPFSIQSVCKVFMLAAALERIGETIFERVDREPSGMSFNSLILLEQEKGRPRNPLINAGAIVVADALSSRDGLWPQHFVELMRRLADSERVRCDIEVAASEADHGDLNRAIAWFLRAKRNLVCHPDVALRAYFQACATEMTCVELAHAGSCLMAAGPDPAPICGDAGHRRRILALMRTCGLYDASGDFAYRVGLPAKSGVGGGMLAIAPERYSVAVWGPGLDPKGNSLAGGRALEIFAEAIGG